VGQDYGSLNESKNAMAGRQQKCNNDIAASVWHYYTRCYKWIWSSKKRGVSMEKNMLVKSIGS
jgi:hypothetical protein